MSRFKKLFAIALGSTMLLGASVQAQNAPVTLTEDQQAYTLSNGIVTARILKRNGDIASLIYKDTELLESASGHAGGYWSHDPTGGAGGLEAKITVDPKTNNGQRAEVSVKGISGGKKMGHGPGAAADGDFPADIDIRYSMGPGESGIYTYCIFDHKPEYPAATMTEARYCIKLASMFDWMSVAPDEHHNKHYPATLREGDKYVYTTNQYKNPAFGWSSTTKNMGFFIINPSTEYLSGGPTKVEFLGHRDTTQVAAPCVLNYWRSSHYGGAEVSVGAGEQWTKVIGPFMLYATSGTDPQAIYATAREQAAKEQKAWPYEWPAAAEYSKPAQRAKVTGQLVLSDPQKPGTTLPNLFVGLAPAAYPSPNNGRQIHWQLDARNYQFWVQGKEDGSFEIPAAVPGKYTLYAFADGVLGQFTKADVVAEAGKPLDLGKLTWTPVRKGKQLWDIGIPNRYGSEFFKAETFWEPAAPRRYAELFPNDVTYTIGKSDFAKDWYFQHVPHLDPNVVIAAPAGRGPATGPTTGPGRAGFAGRGPATGPARGGLAGRGPATGPARGALAGRGPATGPARGGAAAAPSNGRATPYTIVFDLPQAPRGKAILRVALSGTSVRNLGVAVNDNAGQLTLPVNDGVISRHGTHGIWNEQEYAFDATQLKQGTNTIKLTVPAGNVNNGLIYDYLRLELDDTQTAMAE